MQFLIKIGPFLVALLLRCSATPSLQLEYQGELGFSQILCVTMHYSYRIDLGWLEYSFAKVLKVFRTDCPPRKNDSISRFGKCPQNDICSLLWRPVVAKEIIMGANNGSKGGRLYYQVWRVLGGWMGPHNIQPQHQWAICFVTLTMSIIVSSWGKGSPSTIKRKFYPNFDHFLPVFKNSFTLCLVMFTCSLPHCLTPKWQTIKLNVLICDLFVFKYFNATTDTYCIYNCM